MVFYFIIIIYLLDFNANSEMAGCISRLVYETLPILQMLNVVCSLIRFCVRYLSIFRSTEQAALALCCLVWLSPQFVQVVVIVETADQGLSAVGASSSFGGNKNSAGLNLLI